MTTYSNEMLEALEKSALAFLKPTPKVKARSLSPLQKKAIAAAKVVSSNFPTDKRRGLIYIVATILETDVKPMLAILKSSEEHFLKGPEHKDRAIIMLSNPNCHNYKENHVAFLTGAEGGPTPCIQFHDNREPFRGNNAPCYGHNGSWRFATSEEIKAEIARVLKMRA